MTDETNTTAPAPAAAENVNTASTAENVNTASTAVEPTPAPAPAVVDPAAEGTPPAAPAADPAPAPLGNTGDEGPGTPAPKTHFDYHELPSDMRAAVDHARGLVAKLGDVFARVEHEAVDEARKALAFASFKFEEVCHRIAK